MHGNYSTNVLTNQCDVLIAVGMRFDDRVTGVLDSYAKQAKVIHIEIDDAEIDKNVKTTVAVHADAKEALVELHKHIKAKSYPDWLAKFKELDEEEHREVIVKDFNPGTEQLLMSEVVHMLSNKTEGMATTVTDVGQHQMVVSRYYEYKKERSSITSGGLGTMGFSLPAAMGAQLGTPEQPVIAIIGDGGYQMTVQELGTIMQYQIPVKIMVLNNHFLGMVRQWQQLFFDRRYSFTELDNPDFVKLAEAYRIPAQRVLKREELSEAMDRWLQTEGPAFLEVEVMKEDNVFPMVPSGCGVAEIRLK
jgi:acetolactate synthase-1/2/3 large subunit